MFFSIQLRLMVCAWEINDWKLDLNFHRRFQHDVQIELNWQEAENGLGNSWECFSGLWTAVSQFSSQSGRPWTIIKMASIGVRFRAKHVKCLPSAVAVRSRYLHNYILMRKVEQLQKSMEFCWLYLQSSFSADKFTLDV